MGYLIAQGIHESGLHSPESSCGDISLRGYENSILCGFLIFKTYLFEGSVVGLYLAQILLDGPPALWSEHI
jgi:hypothetical protein